MTVLRARGVSFDPSAGDQQMRPRLIIEPADLDSRTTVSCVVDELTVTNEHAGVRDVIGGTAEEQKISGAQVFAVDRENAVPCGLLVRIARHVDSAASHQHLRKAGTIESKTGPPAPRICDSEELSGQFD